MNAQRPTHSEEVPASLIDVAEELGMRVVLALMEHYGGLDMRFPVNPADDHPVLADLGEEDARALCQFLGGVRLYIPKSLRPDTRERVRALEAEGLARKDIARSIGISERHVRRLSNDDGADPRQFGLFD